MVKYVHTNLAVNIVVRLPHPRSTDSILSGPIAVKMVKVIHYLLYKFFVKTHKYHKVFNRNNSKLVIIT